jgi:subtilisin family serine protease
MRLRFGKSGWLELEHIPLTSTVERGVRTFALAPISRAASPRLRAAASRAAAVANRAVVQAFEKWVPEGASPAERAEVGAQKVQTAVFRDSSGSLRVVYREVVIRFEPAVSQARRRALLSKYGLQVRDRNQFQEDQIVAVDPKRKYIAERTIELANELTETDEVIFAFPNFVSEFKRAALAPKPIQAQWHLRIVEARKAWAKTQGTGMVVAVLDDGVDVDHTNLTRNILRRPDPGEPRDLFGRDFFVAENAPDHFDPRPKRFRAPFGQMAGNDIHGTPCAGVIAASGAADGVRGVAPKARVLPVKVFHADDLATESRVANAIRYASRFADILSCSWSGPASPDIELALEEAGAGRNGKGAAIFCATGNETSRVAFPARSNFAIAVGASTDRERLADYSNRGPQVSVVAPSSGGTNGIFTTDVSTSNRGFNTGNEAAGGADGLHTNDFGGTSSATPLAAGIAALVLAVNPNLTRGQVREILQQTADKIGPANSYDARGHSNNFGFGRVNAARAVGAAGKRAAVTTVADKVAAKPRPRAADARARRRSKSARRRAAGSRARAAAGKSRRRTTGGRARATKVKRPRAVRRRRS